MAMRGMDAVTEIVVWREGERVVGREGERGSEGGRER